MPQLHLLFCYEDCKIIRSVKKITLLRRQEEQVPKRVCVRVCVCVCVKEKSMCSDNYFPDKRANRTIFNAVSKTAWRECGLS
jgi:hypothetical protein